MSFEHIDALIQTAVSDGSVPGAVALAADRNGVIYEGAAGRRSVSLDVPMTLDTVMHIASMTKAITAVAVLQQVEAGQLELDVPIGTVLPEYRDREVLLGFHADGAPKTRPAKAPITLRQLLTHTSGLAYDVWDPDVLRYMRVHDLSEAVSRQSAPRIPLRADPGTCWLYGTGIDVAGHAVEVASGMKLGAYVRDRITGPLRMHDTAFALSPSMRARLSPIHVRGPNGTLTPTSLEYPTVAGLEEGGGGLYSTMPDYLRFVRMLLRRGTLDGVTILSESMIEQAVRNQIAPLRMTPLQTAMPYYSCDVDFFPEVAKGYGLIGMVNEDTTSAGRSAGSVGWAGLANTFWWVDFEKQLAAVFATQLLPFADPAAMKLVGAFEQQLNYGFLKR